MKSFTLGTLTSSAVWTSQFILARVTRQNPREEDFKWNAIDLIHEVNDTRNIICADGVLRTLEIPYPFSLTGVVRTPCTSVSLSRSFTPFVRVSPWERPGHCRVEIVRNYDNSSVELAKLMKTRAGFCEEGVKKGMKSLAGIRYFKRRRKRRGRIG